MDLPGVIDLCLAMPGAESTTPFGPDVLVFKVGGKIFALTDPGDFPSRVNLKCDPERSIQLRDQYECITPGYHMNKRHWITVRIEDLPSSLLRDLIHHSHHLVVSSLPGNKRPS